MAEPAKKTTLEPVEPGDAEELLEEDDLALRVEGTRSLAFPPAVERFDLSAIKTHFDDSISQIQAQIAEATELLSGEKKLSGQSILRAQIMFVESALDNYMHELVIYGVTQMFNQTWGRTAEYDRIFLPIGVIESAAAADVGDKWLHEHIGEAYSAMTLTNVKQMRRHLDLLEIKINPCLIATFPGHTVNDAEKILKGYSERRNDIAHRSDRDTETGVPKNITAEEVRQMTNDIKRLVDEIHKAAEGHPLVTAVEPTP